MDRDGARGLCPGAAGEGHRAGGVGRQGEAFMLRRCLRKQLTSVRLFLDKIISVTEYD